MVPLGTAAAAALACVALEGDWVGGSANPAGKGEFKERSQAGRGWSVERSRLSLAGTVLSCGRVAEGRHG